MQHSTPQPQLRKDKASLNTDFFGHSYILKQFLSMFIISSNHRNLFNKRNMLLQIWLLDVYILYMHI